MRLGLPARRRRVLRARRRPAARAPGVPRRDGRRAQRGGRRVRGHELVRLRPPAGRGPHPSEALASRRPAAVLAEARARRPRGLTRCCSRRSTSASPDIREHVEDVVDRQSTSAMAIGHPRSRARGAPARRPAARHRQARDPGRDSPEARPARRRRVGVHQGAHGDRRADPRRRARTGRAWPQIVRATHERWDGAGYPDGLAGAQIPLAARIIAVCDAFSAMTSPRPYRLPDRTEQALDELHRCAGHAVRPGGRRRVLRAAVVRARARAQAQRRVAPRRTSSCRPSPGCVVPRTTTVAPCSAGSSSSWACSSSPASAEPQTPAQETRLDLVAFPGYAEAGGDDPRVNWVTPFVQQTGLQGARADGAKLDRAARRGRERPLRRRRRVRRRDAGADRRPRGRADRHRRGCRTTRTSTRP